MAVTYDIANTILNAARQRLLDDLPSLAAISGSILNRTQGWTQQAFNTVWRKLQTILTSNPESGFQALKTDLILAQFPALVGTDPALYQSIDVAGYWDGSVSHTGPPALPVTLVEPLEVWERIYSATTPSNFLKMDKLLHAVPATPKGAWNKFWQWRGDTLFLPGATNAMDLRIFHSSFLVDIVDVATAPWYTQPVPLSRCLDAMSAFLAAEYLAAQNDDQMNQRAVAFEAAGQTAAAMMSARDTANVKMARTEAQLGGMAAGSK